MADDDKGPSTSSDDVVDSGPGKKGSLSREIFRSYLSKSAVKAGYEIGKSPAMKKIMSEAEELMGKEITEQVVKNGLPLAAALINVKQLLHKKGMPLWLSATIDELINNGFDGVELAMDERHDSPEKDEEKATDTPRPKPNKSVIEEVTYEQAVLKLDPEQRKRLYGFISGLPATHKPRFAELKPQLKSVALIAELLDELDFVQTKLLKDDADHGKRFDAMIDLQFFSLRKATPVNPEVADLGRILARLTVKVTTSVATAIKHVIDDPKASCDKLAASLAVSTAETKAKNDKDMKALKRLGNLQ